MERVVRPAFVALCVAVLALGGAGPGAATDAEGLIAAADPAAGQRVFQKCKACHTGERGGRNLTGPNLWGVVGRSKAAVEGFRYSQALASLGGIWDYADLDAYLLAPRTFLEGGRMAFRLGRSRDRAAVIAYLRTLSDHPFPLPAAPGSAAASLGPPTETEAEFYDLPSGEGREEVRALCSTCHSLQIVVQQGLSARRWDALMDWMIEEQGMDELDAGTRRLVVNYLAAHFGEDRRRN